MFKNLKDKIASQSNKASQLLNPGGSSPDSVCLKENCQIYDPFLFSIRQLYRKTQLHEHHQLLVVMIIL